MPPHKDAHGSSRAQHVTKGIISRVRDATSYVISGSAPNTWMPPLNPLPQMSPPGTQPRLWDFPVGFNVNIQPNPNATVSFKELRALSRNCDILRCCLETRKDQVAALDWQIKPRQDDKTSPDDPRIAKIQTFFTSPDREWTWSNWIRALLEDMMVLDAVAIAKRRDKKGRLYSLGLIDGATVALKVDQNGYRPTPPAVAYQQIIKGMVSFDFTADELIYSARNVSTDRGGYGYSNVRQIINTVNTAIERAAVQLSYCRTGNTNRGVFWIDPEVTADQAKGLKTYWDSLYSGNTDERQKAAFLPGKPNSFQHIVEPPLKDDFDEWLARVICYNLSLPPTPFIKQMNRAVAQTVQESALQEGLAPIQKWIKELIDPIIANEFDAPDLEFIWRTDNDIDPHVQAQIQQIKLSTGELLLNEARANDGMDPFPNVGNTPGMITLNGFVPFPTEEEIAQQKEASRAGMQAATDNLNNPPAEDTDEPIDDPAPPAKKPATKALKKNSARNPLTLDRAAAVNARKAIHSRVAPILHSTAQHVAAQLRGMHVMGKADQAPTDDQRTAEAQRIANKLDLTGLRSIAAISPILSGFFNDAGNLTVTDLAPQAAEITGGAQASIETGMFNQVNTRAVAWADQHAADLVSQITDNTRNMLRQTIAQGMKTTDINGIADQIAGMYAFSDDRALLIADTETAIANGQGALTGYKAAQDLGLKVQKEWLTDIAPCPICEGNADDGPIDLDDMFSSGDTTTPGHPNCLPADSLVTPVGLVSAATRRWFKGDMIIIRTSGNHEITLTPNHPVLTDNGWKPAHLVNEADYVISGSVAERIPATDINYQNVPTRIEEITETFGKSGGVTSREVILSAPDFHADGKAGDIAVIWTNGKLRDKLDTSVGEPLPQIEFVDADVAATVEHVGVCPEKFLSHRVDAASSSFMGGSSNSLPVLGSAPLESNQIGITDATSLNSGFNQPPLNNLTGNPISEGQALFSFASEISVDDLLHWHVMSSRHRVVNVLSESFEGYVYNIQTASGFYIANGLIVHNCHCTTIATVEE